MVSLIKDNKKSFESFSYYVMEVNQKITKETLMLKDENERALMSFYNIHHSYQQQH